MNPRTGGFTLMEMIGVMAVVAIIAAAATPQIFQAIEDAKVTNLVQDSRNIATNVAQYYKDTGAWPRHIPSSTTKGQQQLLTNEDSAGNPIEGWDGPYLDKQLENPIQPGGYVDVLVTSANEYACDLNSDGTGDGQFVVYRVDDVNDDIAKKVSSMLDKDTDQTTGNAAWMKSGKVKRYAGTHAHVLLICVAHA